MHITPADQDVLIAISEYLDDRQDADCTGDPPEYRPNEEMQLFMRLEPILNRLEAEAKS